MAPSVMAKFPVSKKRFISEISFLLGGCLLNVDCKIGAREEALEAAHAMVGRLDFHGPITLYIERSCGGKSIDAAHLSTVAALFASLGVQDDIEFSSVAGEAP